ncbi:SUR7/PalI family-domain-containing protein [Rhizoctonia solani]|nr:SUR7/PalI family-domain-containing protein [Rhizoctonia solani]
MQLCTPALPGFLFTLAATALLAVVSFSVPWFKSVFFLRAAITQSGVSGSVTFGVLGYCLDFNNQVQCSKPSVGWEFDPNTLLGNNLPIEIPNVVVKWITYALVLHIVALALSGVSAVFGLLAQVRTTTMSCFSSCIAGSAAAVALVAFIFDLVLFFAVRARVNSVQGGSASIGNGIWLTLAAWALLFFSGCAYAFGRCCASKSPSGSSGWGRRSRSRKDSERSVDSGKFDRESEHMRLDAVKAEADRKARQKAGQQEVGLPAFYEQERTPLRREEPQYYEEEVEVVVPYQDRPGREPSRASQRTQASGGAAAAATGYRPNRNYEPGAPGTRAIDDYYNNTAPTANTYPPQPQRQPSQPSQRQASIGQPHRQASSHSSNYDPYAQRMQNTPPVPALPQGYQSPPTRAVAAPQSPTRVDPYLAIAGAVGGAVASTAYADNRGYDDSYNHQQYPSSHQQYPSASQQYTQTQGQQDPYAGSSYNPHAAVMSPPQPSHYQDNSNSGYEGYGGAQQQQGYDPYAQQQQRDPYAQDPYAQQQQGYDPYSQQQQYDHYGQQQGYDSYSNQGYQQQTYSPVVAQPQPIPAAMPQPQVHEPEPEPRTMVASPQRGLVSSPSPMGSPSYTPQPPQQTINTAVAAAGPSSGQGHQHQWSMGARSDESPSDAPPPQYEATPGASGYPVEKR